MNDVFVKLCDLPTKVRGFVKKTPDGYTVVLNSKLSWEMNRKTYLHELDHINGEDFESFETVDEIELKRH